MPAFCQDCNAAIDVTSDATGVPRPCPRCGSLRQVSEESLVSSFAAGAQMRTKGYAGGLSKTKGLLFESTVGDSLSVSLGRFVKIVQHVDHETKRYIKKVVDPVTGDVLRDVDEPLSEHQGRGSAKPRDL